MLIVNVKKSGGIEKALKELKRKFSKTGQLKELRERKAFKKPSVQRRDTLKKAQYIQKLRTEENSNK